MLNAADASYGHLDQLHRQELDPQPLGSGKLQEVVEVGGEPKTWGVARQLLARAGADQGGLVGWGGAQEERQAVGVTPAEGGAAARHRFAVGVQGGVTPLPHQQIAGGAGGGGLLQGRRAGGPVVTAPEQQPIGGVCLGEALVHRPEDPRRGGILLLPAEALIRRAELLETGAVLGAGGPVDEQHPPVGKGLGPQGGHQARQERVGIEGGNNDEDRWTRRGLPGLPLPHRHGRVARHDLARGNPAGGHGTQPDHGGFSHLSPGSQRGLGADPGFCADLDGAHGQVEAGAAVVVVAGAEEGPLGEADPIRQRHWRKVVDPDVLSKPAVIAHHQPPGKLHPQAGFEAAAVADLRPEGDQQPAAPGGPRQLRGEQHLADQQPERQLPTRGTGRPVAWQPVVRQVLHHRLDPASSRR